jgi:hypothetical protein
LAVQGISLTNVTSATELLPKTVILESINAVLMTSHLIVAFVIRHSLVKVASFTTNVFILEKNHFSVMSVGKNLLTAVIL